MAKGKTQKPANGSNLDFEAQLWGVADKRHGYMEAAWKLVRMNPAIPAFDANLGPRNADSFLTDLHPDLKADFILANPPFNMSDWGGENLRKDMRWKFWMPPANNDTTSGFNISSITSRPCGWLDSSWQIENT
jgi:hypothetical protein